MIILRVVAECHKNFRSYLYGSISIKCSIGWRLYAMITDIHSDKIVLPSLSAK